MTTLLDYLEAHGHTLEPLNDPTLREQSPGGGWTAITMDEPIGNVAVWADETLRRDGFQPTIIVSTARITPPVDPATILDRLDDTAATLPEWAPRASARSTDERDCLVSDSLGDYRLGEHHLTASTIASVWNESENGDEMTVLRQVVVTTFTDQLHAHGDALRTVASTGQA